MKTAAVAGIGLPTVIPASALGGNGAVFAAAISWKLGRKVNFDPKKESFISDAEANRLRNYQRRAPYTI